MGVASALALPAVAAAQLGPVTDTVDRVGQTVQQTLQQTVPQPAPQVKAPAPAQQSAPAPAAPAAPKPALPAAPAAPAPSASSGNHSAGSNAGAAASNASSGKQSSGHKARARASKSKSKQAHAASAGKPPVSLAAAPFGQEQVDDSAGPSDAGSFTNDEAATTGTPGDSRLPFTGSYVLWLAAIGVAVLLTGVLLRTAARTRLARRS